MRSNSEMLSILKGSKEEKVILFNEIFEAVANGEILSDGDVIIFETLKSMLYIPESQIVEISANLNGSGGAAA